MATEQSDGISVRIARCALSVSEEPWSYAIRHRDAIAAHWRRTQAERPKMFDGTVHVLLHHRLNEGTLSGTFARTDFKSFLHWRDCCRHDDGTRDAFGSSVIRSSEGHVLLGRQSEGHLNAGLAYPPSGLIDGCDAAGGRIDIDASIVRELVEETGLKPSDLARAPGYVATFAGPILSIAVEWRSPLPAQTLRSAILDHVAREKEPELDDIVIVRSLAEIGDPTIAPYARSKLRLVMSA